MNSTCIKTNGVRDERPNTRPQTKVIGLRNSSRRYIATCETIIYALFMIIACGGNMPAVFTNTAYGTKSITVTTTGDYDKY